MTQYRDTTVTIVAWSSAFLAAVSLVLAWQVHCGHLNCSVGAKNFGVGFWVLAPPLWFFFEWFYLCKGLPKRDLEWISHTHDLARNIWLALVIVLAALLDVHFLGAG